MTNINQIRCDVCNKILQENEVQKSKALGLINTNKPESRYHIAFRYEGVIKQGDLCFSCARKLRDFIDNLKER